VVRTSGFHPGNSSSILLRVTKDNGAIMKNNTKILIISTVTFITSLFIFSYLKWTYANTWMEFPFELLWVMFTSFSMVTMFLSTIGVFTEHNHNIRRLNK
tara:strand:+ start:40 stop:339 length:300 start_codon:yes stop_codon:yes gene_type:complete